jgi:hypothetical protein
MSRVPWFPNLVSKVGFGLDVVAMLEKLCEGSNFIRCIVYLNNEN